MYPSIKRQRSVTVASHHFPSQVYDSCFRFGDFGGRYVPETLVDALDELDRVCELGVSHALVDCISSPVE